MKLYFYVCCQYRDTFLTSCCFCFSAAQFIKQKLPDLLRSYVDADLGGNQEGGFQDIAIEVLHLLLSHLLFGQKGASGVGQEQIDAFLKTLCRGTGDKHKTGATLKYIKRLCQTEYKTNIIIFQCCCATFVYVTMCCVFRFPPGALPCGARTTAVPWKTGHSHGQDPARLGGVS